MSKSTDHTDSSHTDNEYWKLNLPKEQPGYPRSWSSHFEGGMSDEMRLLAQANHDKQKSDEIDQCLLEAREILQRKEECEAKARIDASLGDEKAQWLLDYVDPTDRPSHKRRYPQEWYTAHEWENHYRNIYGERSSNFAQAKKLAASIKALNEYVNPQNPAANPHQPPLSRPSISAQSEPEPMDIDNGTEMDISDSPHPPYSPSGIVPRAHTDSLFSSSPASRHSDDDAPLHPFSYGSGPASSRNSLAVDDLFTRSSTSRIDPPTTSAAESESSATLPLTDPQDELPRGNLRQLKIRKKSVVTEANTTDGPAANSSSNELIGEGFPEWYTKIYKKHDRRLEAELRRLFRDPVNACKTSTNANLEKHLNDLREGLHVLEFIKVDAATLKAVKLLHPQYGLPQVFRDAYSNGINYPWDIKSDAQELYNKWYLQVFDPDLLRGIKAPAKNKLKKDKISWALDPNYKKRVASFHGNGALINGQWWPRQICAVRDGAHGAPIAGIFGSEELGAYSVVMSGEEYHRFDKDEGDVVWYSGTVAKSGSDPTQSTAYMRKSVGSERPVRLMRSANLHKSNKYKPQEGFRYDGLYMVVEEKLLDKNKGHYHFKLVRCPDQPPIRAEGVEARPTKQELERWATVQKQLGMSGSFE